MRRLYIFILWSVSICHLRAADSPLDLKGIAGMLGYPESKLIVTDVTSIERKIHESPSRKERREGTRPPFGPERVLGAWKVESTEPGSFVPMLLSIYQKDTLKVDLTTTKVLEKGTEDDGAAVTSYSGFIRSESNAEGFPDPHESFAIYSVSSSDARNVDIRIAFLPGLLQVNELAMVKGGERYHERFAGQDLLGMSGKMGHLLIDLAPHVTGSIGGGMAPGDGTPHRQQEDGASAEDGAGKLKDYPPSLLLILPGLGVLLLAWMIYRRMRLGR